MKKIIILILFCLFVTGCSAGTPEEQQELAQALQSLGQEQANSPSDWSTLKSYLEEDATAEASWDDVIKALNEKEPDDTSLSFLWNLAKDIFWGDGETSMPSATPTPIPAEPTSAPEPTASPTPTPAPTAPPEEEEEDPLSDGVHIIQRIERFLY